MAVNNVVLLIEDDADLRLLAELTLELEGYEVVAASNGEEALALIDRCQPDAVVLDIRLPGMDGWDVVRQLRVGGRFLTIPVVVFSAYGNESSAGDFGCAYLPKPFHPQELTTTLRTALGHEDG